jgi:hypothetical protein
MIIVSGGLAVQSARFRMSMVFILDQRWRCTNETKFLTHKKNPKNTCIYKKTFYLDFYF